MTTSALNFATLSQMPAFAADCQRYCAFTWYGQNVFRAALSPFSELWLEPDETSYITSSGVVLHEQQWGESWYGEA